MSRHSVQPTPLHGRSTRSAASPVNACVLRLRRVASTAVSPDVDIDSPWVSLPLRSDQAVECNRNLCSIKAGNATNSALMRARCALCVQYCQSIMLRIKARRLTNHDQVPIAHVSASIILKWLQRSTLYNARTKLQREFLRAPIRIPPRDQHCMVKAARTRCAVPYPHAALHKQLAAACLSTAQAARECFLRCAAANRAH